MVDYVEINKIPFPSEILKGNWDGIVYAITTCGGTIEDHNKKVDDEVLTIKEQFNNKNHYTVSLRESKRELVCNFKRTETYMTLIEFYVKDIY